MQPRQLESGAIVFADGSVYHPGFVEFADGSEAAAYERKQRTQGNRSWGKTGGEKVFVPSNDAITEEASRQMRTLIERGPAPYNSSSDRGTQEGKPEAWGRIVEVAAGIKTTGVWTPLLDLEEDLTVVLQPQDFEFSSLTLQSILLNIQWMVGGATFSKQAVLNKNVPFRWTVNARRVQVDLTGINIGDPTFGGKTLHMAVAVGRGREHITDSMSPIWVPGAVESTDAAIALPFDQVPLSKGYLLSSVVIGQVVLAGPLYPMFFDNNVLPVNGDSPFLVLSPLNAAGDIASADDEFVPSWAFALGLTFALSSTPDVYTAAPGNQARVDVKVGS